MKKKYLQLGVRIAYSDAFEPIEKEEQNYVDFINLANILLNNCFDI